ncbi:MAG: hypothetical protein HZB23_08415 [Deltaproteobacteria bacterium]|nr:hypothetical protein [Deltaproteobacteria bacterium]
MSITFNCPDCRSSIAANEKFAGRQGKCPKCGYAVRVPKAFAQKDPNIESGFTVTAPNIRIFGEPNPKDPAFIRDFTAAIAKIGESGAELMQMDFSQSAYREGNRLPFVSLAKNTLRPYQTKLQISLTGVFTS